MASTIEYVPQPVTRFPDDLTQREAGPLYRDFAIQVDRYLKNLSDVTIPSMSGGVSPSDLLDYLFLPGRSGGQTLTRADNSTFALRIHSTAGANNLLQVDDASGNGLVVLSGSNPGSTPSTKVLGDLQVISNSGTWNARPNSSTCDFTFNGVGGWTFNQAIQATRGRFTSTFDEIKLRINAAAGQTLSLTEWQDSVSNVLGLVDANGGHVISTADNTTVPLTVLPTAGVSTTDLVRVYTRDLNNLGIAIDYVGQIASSGFIFYPSGNMFVGFGLILSSATLTANRIIKFPNVNGNVMVAVGAVDLTGKTAPIASTQILSLANVPVGLYLVTAEVMCTTAGSGTLAVNILETDNIGAFTDPIINGFSMAATGRTQSTKGYRVTGAATLRYSVTGTFTGTYALYIRVNSLS